MSADEQPMPMVDVAPDDVLVATPEVVGFQVADLLVTIGDLTMRLTASQQHRQRLSEELVATRAQRDALNAELETRGAAAAKALVERETKRAAAKARSGSQGKPG